MIDLPKEIERSLQTEFRKSIWRPFTAALDRYSLIDANDKIAIGLSGGKDSFLLCILLRCLQKHSRIPFEIVPIAMNPGFLPAHQDHLLALCQTLRLEPDFFSRPIFEVAGRSSPDSPCFLCARMRRGALYERAKALSANKLALGHHFDDVIETNLLNMLYAGNFMTLMPKIRAEHFDELTLIRPLYLMEESAIKAFWKKTGLQFLDCACTVAAKKTDSKRREIKQLIESLEQSHQGIRASIFRSAQNVHLDAVLGFTEGEERVEFSEIYARNESRRDRARRKKMNSERED